MSTYFYLMCLLMFPGKLLLLVFKCSVVLEISRRPRTDALPDLRIQGGGRLVISYPPFLTAVHRPNSGGPRYAIRNIGVFLLEFAHIYDSGWAFEDNFEWARCPGKLYVLRL
jgi:hypothetical protein